MQQVSQFSVFGFNTVKQDIIDSDIFVMINYSMLAGALICMQCDINIKQSQLEFIAHGIKISALILKSIIIVQITEVNISFRFKSNFSSAIVNQVNQTLSSFNIAQSILTGFNYQLSASNGYICSKIYADIHVQIASLSVCIENMTKFGVSSFIATQTELETLICANICKTPNYYITYGLCQQQPQFSTLLSNYTVICEHPFIFNDQINLCECDFGFYLNVSFCVNVIDQFSITQKNATILGNELRTEITKTELELKTAFIGLEQLIISNITALVKNINDNDLATNNNIINTNQTIHKSINDLRTENTNQFSTMTGQIENKHLQTTDQINTEFNRLTNFINDNQVNVKNNFTAQKDQITDFRTNIQSTLNLMDSHITNFQNDNRADLSTINSTLKTKLDTLTTLINENQVNIKNNFTAQKDQITDLATTFNTRFTTLDSSVSSANTKLDTLKTQLTGSQTSIESKINGVTQQLQFVSDQNINTQTIINSFKDETSNKFSAVTTLINSNQQFVQSSFTQTNLKIDSVVTKVNAVVTNSQFQAQIDQLKQQISSISSNISPAQYQCLMQVAWLSANYAGHVSADFAAYMRSLGCSVATW
ncbi:Hypothetical_protein [Hexamita inflata]|uniref:Hypothetical_protein n=1 Tax=Hexamita inflata TaxID=28002 RepID=A0AA86NPP2_9EUKA|nr:Hypothetical protein HINF_LOCUS11832 [Hexamita inflata]